MEERVRQPMLFDISGLLWIAIVRLHRVSLRTNLAVGANPELAGTLDCVRSLEV
jgi:hypothetical protein